MSGKANSQIQGGRKARKSRARKPSGAGPSNSENVPSITVPSAVITPVRPRPAPLQRVPGGSSALGAAVAQLIASSRVPAPAVAAPPVVVQTPAPRPADENVERNPVREPVAAAGRDRRDLLNSGPRGSGLPVRESSRSVNGASYMSNVLAYSVALHESQKELKARMEKYGVKVRTSNELKHVNDNPHAVSAAVRAAATAHALGVLYSKNVRNAVTLWGSKRDLKINQHCNQGVEDRFRLELHRPLAVAGDLSRMDSSASDDYDIDLFEAFLMVDVYLTSSGPLDATFVDRHLPTDNHVFVWLGHDYNGAAGVVHGEGVWLRNSNKITSYPDSVASAYAPHEACDWMFTRSHHNFVDHVLAWTVVRAFGNMKVVLFKRVNQIVPVELMRQPARYDWVETPKLNLEPDTHSFFGRMVAPIASAVKRWIYSSPAAMEVAADVVSKEKVLVNIELFEELSETVVYRHRSGLAFKQLIKMASDKLRSDEDFKMLRQRFPSEFSNLAFNTAAAAFVHGAEHQADLIQCMNQAYGEIFERTNLQTQAIGQRSAPGMTWKEWAKMFAAASFVALCIRKFPFLNRLLKMLVAKMRARGMPHAAVWRTMVAFCFWAGMFFWRKPDNALTTLVADVVVTPYLEEKMRRTYQWVHNGIIFIEVTYHITTGNLLGAAICFLFHRLCKTLPFPLAWGFHTWWNWVAWQHTEVGAEMAEQLGITTANVSDMISSWNPLNEELLSRFQLPSGSVISILSALWCRVANLFSSAFGRFWVRERVADKPSAPLTRYERMRNLWYFSPWAERSFEVDQTFVEPFPLHLSWTPVEEQAHFPEKPADPMLRVLGKFTLPGRESKTQYWWILPHSVPGYVPARSDFNLDATLRARILVKPPLSPALQAEMWRKFDSLLPAHPLILWEVGLQPWLAHFEDPRKRREYRRAVDLYLAEGQAIVDKCVDKVELFVKTNEMLFKFDSPQVLYMKPRSIANVNIMVQVDVGPVIFQATQRLKKVCSMWPEPVQHKEVSVYLSYAGAATDRDLSQWWQNVKDNTDEKALYIIGSGDDSLVVSIDGGQTTIYEGDASMFDQSQSIGPLAFEAHCLRRLGVNRDVTNRLMDVAHASYVAVNHAKTEKVKISRTERPMRDTGGADTSIGNFLVMTHAWVFVLLDMNEGSLQEKFLSLGLDMKIRTHSRIETCTFLKGMWFRVDDPGFPVDYWWAPLPSRLLKVGKTLRDPRVIFKEKDFTLAATAYLGSVAATYASFAQVPLLRAFVRNFSHYAVAAEKLPSHKVVSSGDAPILAEDAAIEQVATHYGCELPDVVEFECLYPRTPFVFFSHPIFYLMALKDYSP